MVVVLSFFNDNRPFKNNHFPAKTADYQSVPEKARVDVAAAL